MAALIITAGAVVDLPDDLAATMLDESGTLRYEFKHGQHWPEGFEERLRDLFLEAVAMNQIGVVEFEIETDE